LIRKEKTLGRPGHKWEDNAGMDLRRTGCGPVVVSCEHSNEPSGPIKSREFS